MLEQTLSIIKPDAVERNLENKIQLFFKEKKLNITKSKKVKISKEEANEFYKVHQTKPFYYDLCNYYDKVINLNLLKEDYTYSYNELQMKLFSGADGFISTNGGGGFLCSYFRKPIIFYVPHGKELRPGYLTKSNSYVKKLSNADIHVVLDEGEVNDYSKLTKKIKEVYRGKNK